MWIIDSSLLLSIIDFQPGRRYWGHSGAVAPKLLLVPPKRELCLPSKDCAPKKVTGSVPLECSSRPETPKILVTTPEFVSKNCFFRRLCDEDPFFGLHPRIRGISRWRPLFFGSPSQIWNDKVFVPPENYLCPPIPVTLLLRRTCFQPWLYCRFAVVGLITSIQKIFVKVRSR